MKQHIISIETLGRSMYRIDQDIDRWLTKVNVPAGLCHLFIQHTSASLLITENADPDVHRDLETWMNSAVIDGDPRFRHDAEGPDDMSAHIRSVLTQTSLSVPVTENRLALGTWQGIYLWEHRSHPHRRKVLLTVLQS